MNPKSVNRLESDVSHRTLKVIGETLGLTRERVRQIESKALIKLQKQLNLRNLKRMDQFI